MCATLVVWAMLIINTQISISFVNVSMTSLGSPKKEATGSQNTIYFQMADSRCLTQEKEDLLRKKTPKLMKLVTTSKYFWAVMAKYDVLTQDALSSIQVSNLTKTSVNIINVVLYHCTIWISLFSSHAGRLPRLYMYISNQTLLF